MAIRKVCSSAPTSAPPDQVWAVVSDFCAPWHPAITSMAREMDAAGHIIRTFTVQDETTIYREQLTYISHSRRVMAYIHLEGIAGAESYSARLEVREGKAGGSVVSMTAEIEADQARAEEIAEGTQWIFDAGIAAIFVQAPLQDIRDTTPVSQDDNVATMPFLIDSAPALALTVTPLKHDTLVLFLHGIGGNRDNWAAQLSAIAPYARAAALDLRGYGDSTLGPEQSTIDDYCADILRVRAELGAKNLILCGLSYGAWIAASFAMRHSDLLAGLVLSGGCTGMSEAGVAERDAFRQSREVPMDAGKSPADFAPAVVDVIAGPDAGADVRGALKCSMEQISAPTYRDALRCFTNPSETFDFGKLTIPVLLMTGAHDRLAPPDEISAVADRIWEASVQPDVQFEMIKGAGHVCNLENPHAYNAALVSFVKRLTS